MSDGHFVSIFRIKFSPKTNATCYAEILVITWCYRAQNITVLKVYTIEESCENFRRNRAKLSHSDERGECWTMFMYNYFSSPHLFSDVRNGKINCCGIVHHNKQVVPTDCGLNTLKLWKGDIVCKVKGGASAVCWKGKRQEASLPPHQEEQPASIGSFCGRRRKSAKAHVHEELH